MYTFFLQVRGNLILISADVEATMEKILPIDQNLFPVALKRKLQYEGFFLREVIDKTKVQMLFDWLKKNNQHYIDAEFHPELIDEFCENIRDDIESFEASNQTAGMKEPEDEITKESIEEVPIGKQYDTLMIPKYEDNNEDNTYTNRLALMITEFEQKYKIPKDEFLNDKEEDISSDEECEEEENDEDDPPTKKRKMGTVNVAPGEHGEFQNWGKDIYIEEKAFPHLFVSGRGGYLSSNLNAKHKIGFSAYVRNRIQSVDSRFREDNFYIFFLVLVKEKIEIQRCTQTFLRQAKRTPNLNKQMISDVSLQELERFNRTYTVFRQIRGSPSYYQHVKKEAMAFLRQMGSPTLFLTISYAEFKCPQLFHQVLETIFDKTLSQEEVEAMNFTQSEKNKIIADNVVQTTFAFERRLQKLLNLLKNREFIITKSGRKIYVADFIGRLELQMRFVIIYQY